MHLAVLCRAAGTAFFKLKSLEKGLDGSVTFGIKRALKARGCRALQTRRELGTHGRNREAFGVRRIPPLLAPPPTERAQVAELTPALAGRAMKLEPVSQGVALG